MARLDPADGLSATPQSAIRRSTPEAPTKHPMICLAGGFGFIIVGALAVHLVFNAIF